MGTGPRSSGRRPRVAAPPRLSTCAEQSHPNGRRDHGIPAGEPQLLQACGREGVAHRESLLRLLHANGRCGPRACNC
eukprot:6184183-Prymnesium_polylepis.1